MVIFFGSLCAQESPAPPSGGTPSSDVNVLKERARALAKQGDYAKAIKAFDAAVAAAAKAYGANDQKTDILVNELAIAHYNQGNYTEVEPLYQRVLRNTEARSGHDIGEVATCLNNLGALYDEMGDYSRAEETYLRSLSLRESAVELGFLSGEEFDKYVKPEEMTHP